MRLRAYIGYDFERVTLEFDDARHSNVFALKNNKTLGQTLQHPRYAKFFPDMTRLHSSDFDRPLGEFLLSLKLRGDSSYKRFLNPYGDGTYVTFRVGDNRLRSSTGIYAYVIDEQVMYLGRCRDSLSKRVNQGYGKIHPKNCFLDGQATNCHLNGRITSVYERVELWFCRLQSSAEIEAVERDLIRAHNPPWNLQRYL